MNKSASMYSLTRIVSGADPGIFVRGGSNQREKFDKQKTKEEGGRFSVYSA